MLTLPQSDSLEKDLRPDIDGRKWLMECITMEDEKKTLKVNGMLCEIMRFYGTVGFMFKNKSKKKRESL